MKLYAIFASLMFAAVSAESCGNGYWSETGEKPCNFACSPGCAEGCNIKGGACTGISIQCADGWVSSNDNGKCDSPICNFERNGVEGCANGGKCIAPDTCICGQSGAQIVAKTVYKADGVTADGTDCVSLRRDGIIGSFIALCVMTVSVSFCAITERHLTKKKNAAKSA